MIAVNCPRAMSTSTWSSATTRVSPEPYALTTCRARAATAVRPPVPPCLGMVTAVVTVNSPMSVMRWTSLCTCRVSGVEGSGALVPGAVFAGGVPSPSSLRPAEGSGALVLSALFRWGRPRLPGGVVVRVRGSVRGRKNRLRTGPAPPHPPGGSERPPGPLYGGTPRGSPPAGGGRLTLRPPRCPSTRDRGETVTPGNRCIGKEPLWAARTRTGGTDSPEAVRGRGGRSAAPATDRGRRPVVAALMLGMALAAIDGTIVSTAVPQIVGDLGGFSVFSWLFSGYLLAVTVTLPVYGKLSDTFGRKPVLIAGIILFLVGSAALRRRLEHGGAHRLPRRPGPRRRRPPGHRADHRRRPVPAQGTAPRSRRSCPPSGPLRPSRGRRSAGCSPRTRTGAGSS